MELNHSGPAAFDKSFGQSLALFLVGADQGDRYDFGRNRFGVFCAGIYRYICRYIFFHCITSSLANTAVEPIEIE